MLGFSPECFRSAPLFSFLEKDISDNKMMTISAEKRE